MTKKGKLIVLEGTDGSGKSTQFGLLTKWLSETGHIFQKLVFPQYAEPSSALIRMYLGGEFGRNPTDVNAYAASAFYAVDRYASYKKLWQDWYNAGGLIVSDRYTTSNAVHQASKESGPNRDKFLAWLYDFEYDKMGLPNPDLVIYLDVPTEFTETLMRNREQATNTKADIHEQDMAYLATCRETGRTAAKFYGWTIIDCVKDGKMRTIEDIHAEIQRHVQACLNSDEPHGHTPSEFVPKSDYDRAIDLLRTIVQNEIQMSNSANAIRYFSDIGFTDDELTNIMACTQADIDKAKSDTDWNDSYDADYPDLDEHDKIQHISSKNH